MIWAREGAVVEARGLFLEQTETLQKQGTLLVTYLQSGCRRQPFSQIPNYPPTKRALFGNRWGKYHTYVMDSRNLNIQ